MTLMFNCYSYEGWLFYLGYHISFKYYRTHENYISFSATLRDGEQCAQILLKKKKTCYELLGKRSSSSSFNISAVGLSVLLLRGNSQGPSGNTADQIPTPKGNLLLGQLNNVQEEESGAATWCLLHFQGDTGQPQLHSSIHL